ncbi:resuscitation-promoting factor, partial [Streptomyces anulatus]
MVFPGAFHEQLTVADGIVPAGGPAAHAPTVVDVPLAAPPPVVPRQGATRAGARRAPKRRRTLVAHPESLRRLVPKALVVAFLAGGTTAFVAHDKAVRLSVDGTPRTLHTFA